MSKKHKPWRNPANPDYKSPALDTSTQQPAKPEPQVTTRQALPQQPGPTPNMSHQDALDCLTAAARCLHALLNLTTTTLSKVTPEAFAQVAQEAPMPPDPDLPPQKRPRSRVHPLLVLSRITISASSLVSRIMPMVFPDIFAKGGIAARAAGSMEAFVGKVKSAMEHLGLARASA